MEKVDILLFFLGVAAYFAILLDLRSYENKLAQFEIIQEKRRQYFQLVAERRKTEIAREKAAAKKVSMKRDFSQLSSVVEKLGALQDEEVMRKSKITSGKIA